VRRSATLALGIAAVTLLVAGAAAWTPEVRATQTAYARLPISFVPNAGQSDARVRFLARDGEAAFFFTRSEAVVSLRKGKLGHVLTLRFVDANPEVRIEGTRRMAGRVNYLLGNDPTKWHSGLPTDAELVYRDLWPGIDLAFTGARGTLKHEFRVQPGADPSRIKLAYAGATRLALDRGALAIGTTLGTLTDSRPASYQEIDGERTPVTSRFVLRGARTYGFAVADHHPRRPLVIDPALPYSTFLGGASRDIGSGVAVDAAGSAYVTGQTLSADFPTTPGAFDRSLDSASVDAFVTKLDPAGRHLVYSTYLGGAESDSGAAIAVDLAGSASVTGVTTSADFPTTEAAFDRTHNGYQDVFVTKLGPAGTMLTYSTYVGGSYREWSTGLAVDAGGNAYVGGLTGSSDFPATPGAFDTTWNGSDDVFVTKLNASGSALVYSTFLGGGARDLSYGLAIDGRGSAYATGWTGSAAYPTTPGAFDGTFNGGDSDAFATRLSTSGNRLAYSTFLGGAESGSGMGVAVDQEGSAYLTGWTFSPDFPTTPGAFDTELANTDAWVTKLPPSGSTLSFSSFLGGSSLEYGWAVAVDRARQPVLTGYTGSPDFPTTRDAFDRGYNEREDAFVTRFTVSGSALAYSTFLGGTFDFPGLGHDSGQAIAVDREGYAYVSGRTSSTDFPTTPGAFDRTYGGFRFEDGFVAKLPTPFPTKPPGR
jgi:hypothetical protein